MNFEIAVYCFIAQYIWPYLRPIVGRRLSRRCKKCILSENYTPLNSEGICAECVSPGSQQTLLKSVGAQIEMEAGLEKTFRGMPGSGGGEYDAIILFSGGKDSCFLLYELRKHHPDIRLLALTVDNHFLSPVAMTNVARTIAEFDVGHFTFKPSWPFVKKLFRRTLLSVEKEQHYPPSDLMDGNLTFLTAFKLARKLQVPYIISGLSRAQSEHVLNIQSYKYQVNDFLFFKEKGVSTEDYFLSGESSYLGDDYSGDSAQSVTYLSPLYVWNKSEEEILDCVDDLGLIDKSKSHPLVTNNDLIPTASFVEAAQFGFTKFEIEFARMIRGGKAERKLWFNIFQMLEFSGKTGMFVNKTVDQVLKRLDLSKSEMGLK